MMKKVLLANDTLPTTAPAVAGIHLSGPNAAKTALVVLRGDTRAHPLRLEKVYEKIGAFGTLFSDDRLLGILRHEAPLASVFVDSPLTLPPCVACQRPVCPGATHCEDIGVAYMLALSTKVRRRGARKARPINPQSQRLWDVLHSLSSRPPVGQVAEPTYGTNQAPLAARARTLQRRLRGVTPPIELGETSVANTLSIMAPGLGLVLALASECRNFERGHATRHRVLERMVELGWLEAAIDAEGEERWESVIRSPEVFSAFITAWVAAAHCVGLTEAPPADFAVNEGWVHLPRSRTDKT